MTLDDDTDCIAWQDESESSLFTIYPAVGEACGSRRDERQTVRDGSTVCLFAPNGYFLSFDGERLAANRPYYIAGPSAEFIVHVEGGGILHNRGTVFLKNRASSFVLEVDSSNCPLETSCCAQDSSSFDSACDAGVFVVEKVVDRNCKITRTPRRRRLVQSSVQKIRSRSLFAKLAKCMRRCNVGRLHALRSTTSPVSSR